MSRINFFSPENISEKEKLICRLSIITEHGNNLIRQMHKNKIETDDSGLKNEFDTNLQRIKKLEARLAEIEKKTIDERLDDKHISSVYFSPIPSPSTPIHFDSKILSLKKKKAILISIFSAKGGVGKTTATYNFGYMLAQQFGLRVLMVDADSQCNLTGMILTEAELNEFYEKQEIKENKGDSDSDDLISIYDCFKPLIDHEELPPLERAKKVKISKVKNYNNLFYIPGHLSLSDIDHPITLGMGHVHGHDKYLALFTSFFRIVAEDNDIDIVLFDLGPSVVGLNPTVIMGSDYFMTPFFSDSLSKQAIRSLHHKLPKWKSHLAFQNLNQKNPSGPWHMKLNPLFLGAFPQKLKYQKRNGPIDLVEQSYANWIAKINTEVENLCNDLSTIGMLSPNFRKIKKKSGYGIRDFAGMGLDVQQFGRPICDIDFDFTHPKTTLLGRDQYKIEQQKLSNHSIKIQKEVFFSISTAGLCVNAKYEE